MLKLQVAATLLTVATLVSPAWQASSQTTHRGLNQPPLVSATDAPAGTGTPEATLSTAVDYYPNIDGHVVPDDPAVLIGTNRQARVPLLFGYNADEACFGRGMRHRRSVLAGQPPGLSRWGGAAHTSEIPYIFGEVTAGTGQYEERDQALSQAMVNAWVAFATTGNPNRVAGIPWPTSGPPKYRLLNFGDAVGVESEPRSAQVDLFRRAVEAMRGNA